MARLNIPKKLFWVLVVIVFVTLVIIMLFAAAVIDASAQVDTHIVIEADQLPPDGEARAYPANNLFFVLDRSLFEDEICIVMHGGVDCVLEVGVNRLIVSPPEQYGFFEAEQISFQVLRRGILPSTTCHALNFDGDWLVKC